MTVEEMTDTLSRLGVEVHDSRGDEINATCAAHKERTGHIDHNPSFWINADSGAFICFSCQWKGNLYTLISYVEGISFDQVDDWMGSSSNMMDRLQRVISEPKEQPIAEPTIVTESMLSAFTEVPEAALKSRGLTLDAANRYGIRWNRLENNWIIPIRDPHTNALLGWQEKGYDRRFFKNTARVKKSDTLFGYNNYKDGDMIVVESPLDVVRLASLGYSGVAIYGASVSEVQFKLISGADRIIFALDNDDAGRSSTYEVVKECVNKHVEAWFFNYEGIEMKDVGGMSRDEIELGLKNARHIVRSTAWAGVK